MASRPMPNACLTRDSLTNLLASFVDFRDLSREGATTIAQGLGDRLEAARWSSCIALHA